ncbi:hypothetical protein B0O80DRAFT_459735 [Mortierella sp. GBAus27b]|nr:hypothetical protein B0O80DRAFT_459735 [Mortierella sp. GBAus27b]
MMMMMMMVMMVMMMESSEGLVTKSEGCSAGCRRTSELREVCESEREASKRREIKKRFEAKARIVCCLYIFFYSPSAVASGSVGHCAVWERRRLL